MKELMGELKRLFGEDLSKESVLLLAESYPLGSHLERKFIELGGTQVARLLAHNPHLSPDGAFLLSRHHDPVVRSRLARRRDLPKAVLLELAKGLEEPVLEELARNAEIPRQVQEVLLERGSERVLRNLIENPHVEEPLKKAARKRLEGLSLASPPLDSEFSLEEELFPSREDPFQEEVRIALLLEEMLLRAKRGAVSLGEVEDFLLHLPYVPQSATGLYYKLKGFLERSPRFPEVLPSR